MNKFLQPKGEHMERLNRAAKKIFGRKYEQMGYPFDQESGLEEYYKWLVDTGLCNLTIINVGDPYKKDWDMLHTDEFEQSCINFLADAYGFDDDRWGVISNGGTDGNMHGIYFGRTVLRAKSKIPPILYVSEEAHYSLKKLGDILDIETRTISAHPMGQMNVEDFEEKLDATRPALVAIAIGGTFKGAIDDQKSIDEVIKRKNPIAVYRHLDVALFGGYLPFMKDENARHIVDASKMGFDSIAVSGHKFLALNEPAGVFICRKETLEYMQNNPIPYLNGVIPTISCSRSGFDALKLYWRLTSLGKDGLQKQAEHVVEMAKLLQKSLENKGVKAWRNPYSNTVFFTRPATEIVKKYALACNSYADFGDLSHIVTMQYFTPEIIEDFVSNL